MPKPERPMKNSPDPLQYPAPGEPVRASEEFYQTLDPEIAQTVRILHRHGIFTLESCQGGPGHSYGYPTVLFDGDRNTAKRVRQLCQDEGLRPIRLRYDRALFYPIKPFWVLTMHHPMGRKLTPIQRLTCWLKFLGGF